MTLENNNKNPNKISIFIILTVFRFPTNSEISTRAYDKYSLTAFFINNSIVLVKSIDNLTRYLAVLLEKCYIFLFTRVDFGDFLP